MVLQVNSASACVDMVPFTYIRLCFLCPVFALVVWRFSCHRFLARILWGLHITLKSQFARVYQCVAICTEWRLPCAEWRFPRAEVKLPWPHVPHWLLCTLTVSMRTVCGLCLCFTGVVPGVSEFGRSCNLSLKWAICSKFPCVWCFTGVSCWAYWAEARCCFCSLCVWGPVCLWASALFSLLLTRRPLCGWVWPVSLLIFLSIGFCIVFVYSF